VGGVDAVEIFGVTLVGDDVVSTVEGTGNTDGDDVSNSGTADGGITGC